MRRRAPGFTEAVGEAGDEKIPAASRSDDLAAAGVLASTGHPRRVGKEARDEERLARGHVHVASPRARTHGALACRAGESEKSDVRRMGPGFPKDIVLGVSSVV